MKWSIGLQTCPRAPIDGVVASIRRAGWDDPIIYAEPGSLIPADFGGRVCFWPERYGDWTNWLSGLFTMFVTQPSADYFLMFEDDIDLATNVRFYLEYALAKLGDFGAVSLYTPARQTYPAPITPCFHDEGWRGWTFWGGQGLVFSRTSLAAFLASDDALLYRQRDDSNGHKDTVVGVWCERTGRPLYCHTPSLAEHLPISSVTGNRGHRSLTFDPKLDASDWVGGPISIAGKPGLLENIRLL